jgi:hypothetical protein
MTARRTPDAGTPVVAILDIGGLDRRFVPRGTRGVLEASTSATTSLVAFEGIGSVEVDDDVEVAAAPTPTAAAPHAAAAPSAA